MTADIRDMGRLSRAWALTKASYGALREHSSLLGVAVVSYGLSLVVGLVVLFVVLGGAALVSPDGLGPRAGGGALWVVYAAAGVAASWVLLMGVIDAFRRSASLLRQTWGENLTFNFALRLLEGLAVAPGVAVAALAIWSGVGPLQGVGVALGVVWCILAIGAVSALSAVFKTALYRYANDLPLDPAFEDADSEHALRRR